GHGGGGGDGTLHKPTASQARHGGTPLKVEWTVRIVFVSYFVHRLLAAGAFVQAVGAVEHQAGRGTEVRVGVHHARRDHDQHRFVLAHHVADGRPVGSRVGPVVPQDHLEVTRP